MDVSLEPQSRGGPDFDVVALVPQGEQILPAIVHAAGAVSEIVIIRKRARYDTDESGRGKVKDISTDNGDERECTYHLVTDRGPSYDRPDDIQKKQRSETNQRAQDQSFQLGKRIRPPCRP